MKIVNQSRKTLRQESLNNLKSRRKVLIISQKNKTRENNQNIEGVVLKPRRKIRVYTFKKL